MEIDQRVRQAMKEWGEQKCNTGDGESS